MQTDRADGPDASPPARDECPVAFGAGAVMPANLPYLAMLALGGAVLAVGMGGGAGGWLAGGGYLAYGLAGALWILLFVCPYSHFHGTRQCPCGYGMLSARMRAARDGSRFARKFRRHIPVIVPLWIVPAVAGAAFAIGQFSWTMIVLVSAFAVDAFVVLPLVSRVHACTACPQRGDCPWMDLCGSTARERAIQGACRRD